MRPAPGFVYLCSRFCENFPHLEGDFQPFALQSVFMVSQTDDAELVRDCLRGDAQAFGVLVERYQKAIFNAAIRMVSDFEEARDISQNVFLKAYENLPSYNPRYKFYSWIYRIAVNESINHLHKRARVEPMGVVEPESRHRGPDQTFSDGELEKVVQEALMTLKTEYRSVVVLRHFLECSYEEMSDILQVPEKTIKSRLFSARQALKDVLFRKGVLI